MATNGQALTLADIAASMVDGKIQATAEILAQMNEILDYLVFAEANQATGHVISRRSGLPTVGLKRFNQGIAPSKSTSEQVTEVMGMIRGYLKIDRDLANINGNSAAFRTREAIGFFESINQSLSRLLAYGNHAANEEEFDGIAPRYSSLSGAPGLNGNVISAGGASAGGQTSIYLLGMGDLGVQAIYPKGSEYAGLRRKEFGELPMPDAAGKLNTYLLEEYGWDVGIAVNDWRNVVRVCNIDVTALAGGSPPDLIKFMTMAEEALQNFKAVKPVYVMHRRVATYLRTQILGKVGASLTFDTVNKKRVLALNEIPIARTDQILCATSSSEAVVS